MEREEWRNVVGTYGYYQVSNLGRLRRAKPGRGRYGDGTWVGRILKPGLLKTGYVKAILTFGKGRVGKPMHQAVLEAFVGKRPAKQPNHRNGIKSDNRLRNLEWLTASENVKHAHRMGLAHGPRGEKSGTAKLTWKSVRAIRREYKFGVYGKGCITLGKKYGVDDETIRNIVTGRYWREEA